MMLVGSPSSPTISRDSWILLGVSNLDTLDPAGAGGRGVVLGWSMSQHPPEVRQGHVGQRGFSRDVINIPPGLCKESRAFQIRDLR